MLKMLSRNSKENVGILILLILLKLQLKRTGELTLFRIILMNLFERSSQKTDRQKPGKEEIFNLRNRYLSVCDLDCSDLILSRLYVIREPFTSCISLICPDPTRYYATNDPVPYVIGNPHDDQFFFPLAKIIHTLHRHHKIVITHIYSQNMCLKERNSNLEGHLVLDVSSDHHETFSIIENIAHLKHQGFFFSGFKMYLPEKKKVNEKCFEQVQRWVHFSSNVKAVSFHGFEPPTSLIEHIAKELYGAVDSGVTQKHVTAVPTHKGQSAKCSSLQILRCDFNFHRREDIENLVRLKFLPQLRVLHLRSFGTHRLGDLLGSGVSSLEELSLEYPSKQDAEMVLSGLTEGRFPKLNSINLGYRSTERCFQILPDFTILSNYGLEINQLKILTKLKSINVIADGYLALEKDILCKTKMNETDTRSLIRTVLPTVTELDLSNETLTGCLGDFLKSDIYLNLSVLDLCNTNLCVDDMKSLGLFCCGQQRLNVLKLSGNTLTNNISHLLDFGLKKANPCCPEPLLDDTKLSRNDMKALSAAAQQGALKEWSTLNLSKKTLTDTLHDLFEGKFIMLETLLLDDIKLSISDVRALSTAARKGKLPQLKTLNLSKNTLTDTLHDLFEGELFWLESLLLEDTKLSVSDMRALSRAIRERKLQHLKTLNLSKNTPTNTLHDLFEGNFDLFEDNFIMCETLLLEDTKLSISDVRALSTAAQQGALKEWSTLNLSKNTLPDTMHNLFREEYQ